MYSVLCTSSGDNIRKLNKYLHYKQTMMAKPMRMSPNKKINEQRNGCMIIFVIVHFFAVLCTIYIYNDVK